MTDFYFDIETYSTVDLTKAGVFKYAEESEVILFAYAIGMGDVQVTTDKSLMLQYVTNPEYRLIAHNAQFERAHFPMAHSNWLCTSVLCRYNGVPAALKAAGIFLNLPNLKLETKGIAMFTKPNKAGVRVMPQDNPTEWAQFVEYAKRDVEVCRELHLRLQPIPERERALYEIDWKMNSTGCFVDTELVDAASVLIQHRQDRLLKELKALTGLENPNSPKQLGQFLGLPSVNKESLEALRGNPVVDLRLELALSSVKKFATFNEQLCKDNKVRGYLQFYGARTGRWSGRGIQPQNLTKHSTKDIEGLIANIKALKPCTCYELSEVTRCCLKQPMTVVDYSAIEARVIAWLAQEDWKLEVFRTHGKIYEATGARMFNVPIEQVVKGSPMRDKAKAAELALGFGGGIDALHAFDNDADVNQVYAWRKANPKIVGLWKAFGDAVACGDEVKVAGCTFRWLDSRTLEIVLPSGRSLFYRGCKWINGSLHYLNDTQNLTKTWGGTLVQNVVQALARDVLAEAMIALDYYGYHILLTVHDEVVVAGHHLKDIEEVMVVVPKWAKGLPLACEGAEFNYYQK